MSKIINELRLLTLNKRESSLLEANPDLASILDQCRKAALEGNYDLLWETTNRHTIWHLRDLGFHANQTYNSYNNVYIIRISWI